MKRTLLLPFLSLLFLAGISLATVFAEEPGADKELRGEVSVSIEGLKDKNPLERLKALFNLEAMRDKDSIPYIRDAVKDNDRRVRKSALTALRVIEGKEALPDLVFALQDKEPDVRRQAITEIRVLKEKGVLNRITKYLKDKDAGVREEAAVAIRELGDLSYVPLLISVMFKDTDFNVRKEAIKGVRNIQGKDAAPVLKRLLKDKDERIKFLVGEILWEWKEVKGLEALIECLRAPDPAVRKNAARQLGGIKGAAVLPVLKKRLKVESEPEVRKALEESINKLSVEVPN